MPMSLSLQRFALLGLASICILITSACAARQPSATTQQPGTTQRGKPWLKPPEQWSQADAKQILKKSPWVRTKTRWVLGNAHEGGDWIPGSTSWNAEGQIAMCSTTTGLYDGAPSCDIGGSGGGYSEAGGDVVKVKLTIVWESADVIWHARSLNAQSSSCPLLDVDEHRIAVEGSYGSERLSGKVEESYLRLPSGLIVAPLRMQLYWGYEFVFPARTADGKLVIPPDVPWVEFVTTTDTGRRVRTKFDLRKMVTAKGRDL